MKSTIVIIFLTGMMCNEIAAQTFASATQNVVKADTMLVRKVNQQAGDDVLIISPNPSNGNLQVKNNHRSEKDIQLYVFDVDGVMIENIRLQARQTKKINGLVKGTYLYDVFVKDESIERGKIVVE